MTEYLLTPFAATRRADTSALEGKVLCCDALELLAQLPDSSVDMVLCDLPYGIGDMQWDEIIPIDAMWQQLRRIAKQHAAIVLTATEPFGSMLRMSARDLYKYDCVWVKTKPSDHIRAKLKPLNKHELILIFSKGTIANCSPNLMNYYPQGVKQIERFKKRNKPFSAKNGIVSTRPNHVSSYMQHEENYPDTVLYFANGNNNSLHPTEKPLSLFEYLIRTYTQEGELVLDMTAGSGTTALACRKTGRRFICGDNSPEYVNLANTRLANSDPYQNTTLPDGTKQLSLLALLEVSA